MGDPGRLKHRRTSHGLRLLQVFVLHSATRSKSAATLQALQQQAAQHERVVVFLDNDTAGRQGRKVLDQALPACWHAFLPLTLEDVDRLADMIGAPVLPPWLPFSQMPPSCPSAGTEGCYQLSQWATAACGGSTAGRQRGNCWPLLQLHAPPALHISCLVCSIAALARQSRWRQPPQAALCGTTAGQLGAQHGHMSSRWPPALTASYI